MSRDYNLCRPRLKLYMVKYALPLTRLLMTVRQCTFRLSMPTYCRRIEIDSVSKSASNLVESVKSNHSVSIRFTEHEAFNGYISTVVSNVKRGDNVKAVFRYGTCTSRQEPIRLMMSATSETICTQLFQRCDNHTSASVLERMQGYSVLLFISR